MASDQEMNERLAKACGWTYQTGPKLNYGGWVPRGESVNPLRLKGPPDYTNDLNACAELRKVIAERGLAVPFLGELSAILDMTGSALMGTEWFFLNATARQIAQATDKVLGGEQ